MKRVRLFVLTLTLLILTLPVAFADTVKLGGVTVDETATTLALDGVELSYKKLAAGLIQLPKLTSVSLGKTTLTAQELTKLTQAFPEIAFSYEVKLYSQWLSCEATEADFSDKSIRDIDKLMSNLTALPKLQKLTAYTTRMSKKEIAALIERFPQIDFHVTLNANGHLVRTDATAFSTLHTEDDAEHSDFSILAYCKQLRAIDIGHNKVKDISFVSELPELRVIVFAGNRIKDISPLASLQHLEYAELFMNEITDISPLGGLTNLLDLNLVDNQVADATPLEGCTSLERAWLGRNPIPESQYEPMKQAMPNCNLNFTVVNCTGDDWRLHPRHKVKRRIFEGGSYVPWDWTAD